jgi:predicted transcriptional regulator
MAKADTTPLTEMQRQIMDLVWNSAEVTVSEVWAVLASQREVARNTVQTMIVRLEDKGWLKHREEGRTFYYSAARPKTVSLGAKVVQMIDRLFAGSPEEMVTALIEYRGLSPDEVQRIRTMIDQAESASQTAERQRRKKS